MLGRDVAAGIAHGARISLIIGVVSTLTSLIIGVTIGATAGYLIFGAVAQNYGYRAVYVVCACLSVAALVLMCLQPDPAPVLSGGAVVDS
jgi:ABC-type dipeptide/oligopeptide/nickel transport system permease subunit